MWSRALVRDLLLAAAAAALGAVAEALRRLSSAAGE